MKDFNLADVLGFNWDSGNIQKNWLKHKVKYTEAEELFFNEPLMVSFDESHSTNEPRFFCLGHTDLNRGLFVVFTVRKRMIRIISARDMNKKERSIYEKAE